MAEAGGDFAGGFGDRRGGRGGRGRGRGRGGRGRGGDGDRGGRGRGGRGGRGRGGRGGAGKDEWVPMTKLGRLVQGGYITSLEEIFLFALPVKEYQIIDAFFPKEKSPLKDEAVKIMPVQKQTNAGQRTRFKAVVVVGDKNGHIGLGTKVAREVASAIRGAIIQAKLAIVPVRRGFWGVKFGEPHTVPIKVTGKRGTVLVRLVPAPRGTGLVAANILKKFLEFAGVQDCYTKTSGKTRTMSNFLGAAYEALVNTHTFLTPDLWAATKFTPTPYQKHNDFLASKGKSKPVKRIEEQAQ